MLSCVIWADFLGVVFARHLRYKLIFFQIINMPNKVSVAKT